MRRRSRAQLTKRERHIPRLAAMFVVAQWALTGVDRLLPPGEAFTMWVGTALVGGCIVYTSETLKRLRGGFLHW